MFTGIVQNIATIEKIIDHEGLRTFEMLFPQGFSDELNIGASVAFDGVCLTVTELVDDNRANFDIISQSLKITTLGSFNDGDTINVERAAKDGAEIGGHPLSGHIDFTATIIDIMDTEENCRLRFEFDKQWSKYIFAKGYIAVNGCSLTIAEVNKKEHHFDVWLIPETRRMTTFSNKVAGDKVNIEIERSTQVIVDTIENTLEEKLGTLYPILEKLLAEQEIDLASGMTADLAHVAK